MKFYQLLFFYLFLFCANFISAQKRNPSFLVKNKSNLSFSLEEIQNLDTLKRRLNHEGYYFYRIKKDSSETYLVDLGQRTSVLKIQNAPSNILELFKTKKNNIYIKPSQFNTWIEKVSTTYDEKGENFTEIKLINHQLQNDTLLCDISIHQSNQRFIDKTVIKGYKKFPKRFLKHYISSKKPFSKELLIETEQKINQLNFVKNNKKPAVLFTKDSTHLYLYTDRVKANKLDALLGFSNKEGENKIRFNGYVDISLTNTLHKGETFAFKWNNTGEDQQEIDLYLDNPYILNSPINLGYHLNIYRKDSTFVNTQHEFSIGYRPHYKHLINTYYHSESSSTLNSTNSNIAAYNKNIFGINYTYNTLNSFGIPKTQINMDFGLGSKKNNTANTQQQTFKSDVIYTIEISPTNHLFLENRNAYLRSPNKNINELYRTGGATTMRGFLEQSIIAHLYNYTNIEYRYFTNLTSYLYGFSDVGYFKNITQENKLLSFGLGYTMGVPSGLLKISYAVGKNQDTSFNLNQGLFHINFVTIF